MSNRHKLDIFTDQRNSSKANDGSSNWETPFMKHGSFFTKACHRPLLWTRRIQFASSNPVSLKFVLMLPFHRNLGLPSGFLTSVCGSRVLFLCYLWCYMSHPNDMWWRAEIMKLYHALFYSLLFSPSSYVIIVFWAFVNFRTLIRGSNSVESNRNVIARLPILWVFHQNRHDTPHPRWRPIKLHL